MPDRQKSTPLRTEQDFDAKFDYDVRWAAKATLAQGTLSRMFVVHCRNGQSIPIVQGRDGDAARDSLHELVRLICIAEDAIAMTCMGEAWFVLHPVDLEVRVSQSDRRQEGVSVTLFGRVPETGATYQASSLRRIERGSDGKITGLSAVPETEGDLRGPAAAAGDIFDVFPLETPSGAERRKARALAERIRKAMAKRP